MSDVGTRSECRRRVSPRESAPLRFDCRTASDVNRIGPSNPVQSYGQNRVPGAQHQRLLYGLGGVFASLLRQ
jgi:hypothetical protein